MMRIKKIGEFVGQHTPYQLNLNDARWPYAKD